MPKTRKIPFKKPYFIDSKYQKLADLGVTELLKKLELSKSAHAIKLTGTRSLTENSVASYGKHFRGLRHYCSIVGDYSGLLILLDTPPEPFCPAMDPHTVANFIRYKRGIKGDPLLDEETEAQIVDVFGNPVYCQGGWKDPKNVDQLLSAVGALHSARGHRGHFIDFCDECIALDGNKEYQGCRFHRGAPRLWRQGNPKDCDLMTNVVNRNSKDGSDYMAQGDSPLTPWEVMDIRTHLMSSNDLADLQFYVMMIVSIKLFLRSEEVVDLSHVQINKDISIISSSGHVEGLALTIKVFVSVTSKSRENQIRNL
jgi:hypothetical protein